jgi:hypothetical protein
MLRKSLTWSLVVALILAVGTGLAVYTQEESVPAIPDITVDDPHPNGCVDCHRRAGDDRDYRLSTAIAEWAEEGVSEALLERSQAAWPDVFLEGQHPAVAEFVADQPLPQSCFNCHKDDSGIPLDPLVHTLHFAGGGQNRFVAGDNGRCLHCHTMNADVGFPYPPTGQVELKSGREQSGSGGHNGE